MRLELLNKQDLQTLAEIKLREFVDSDVRLIENWFDKDYIGKWFDKEAWLYELNHRKKEFSFIKHFIFVVDGIDVGFCQYYDYSKGGETFHNNTDITDTYSIDYLIGEEEYLHHGYSTKLIELLEEEIKNNRCKKIIVQPEKDNIKSRNALLKANYKYDKKNDFFYKNI